MKKNLFGTFTLGVALFAGISGVNAATTMPEAVDGTIKLTEDVTLASRYVVTTDTIIELNGHKIETAAGLAADTITVQKDAKLTLKGEGAVTNSNNKDNYAAIYNNGNVEIKNATLKLDKTVNGNTYYVILNHGKMTLDNANITSNDETSSMIANGYSSFTSTNERKGYVSAINQEKPLLTINSGVYDGGMNTVKNDDNGSLIINGGTFKNTVQVDVMNWNEATINGGTFQAPIGENKTNIFVGSYGTDTEDKGILVINGGTFEADHALEGSVTTPVEINGGTFNNTKEFINPATNTYVGNPNAAGLVKLFNDEAAEGVNIKGTVTVSKDALKYAEEGSKITLTDTVNVGDTLDIKDGVTVVLNDNQELVKDATGSYVVKEKVVENKPSATPTTKTTNPKTSDNMLLNMFITLVSAMALAVSGLYYKKNYNK